jgi:hypothetical protein
MAEDQLAVELFIDDEKADIALKSFQTKLSKFEKTVENINPDLDFTKAKADVSDFMKRTFQVQTALKEAFTQRLDAGNIGHLTKEMVKAAEQTRNLQSNLENLYAELANPNRASSIEDLQKDIANAESQLASYERKLEIANQKQAQAAAKGQGLRDFAGQQVSGLIGDAGLPAGISEALEAKALAAINTVSVASIAAIGGIAAVGFAVIKLSESLRDEAERRLKLEEKISIEYGKQVSQRFEILKTFREQRKLAEEERNFSRFLQNSEIDELKRKRDLLQKAFEINPLEDSRLQPQILALDERIFEASQERIARQDEAFAQRFQNFINLQEAQQKQREEAEQRQREAAKRFQESVEKGKEKIKELGKTFESVFEGLNSRSLPDNAFAKFFADADKSAKALRENTRGLSLDLQAAAFQLERQINQTNLFSIRLDTQLQAFGLREDAAKFRQVNQIQAKPTDFQLDVNKIINGLSGGEFIGVNGAKLLSQRNAFFDLSAQNRESIISALARQQVGINQSEVNANLSVQERLNKQLAVIRNLGASSEAERVIANRKIIELTQGLNPNDLSQSLREQAALAREREAERLLRAENEAIEQGKQNLAIQTKIEAHLSKLAQIAEKEGLQGIENLVRIVDETGGKVRVAKLPTQSDTQKRFNQ